MERVKVKNGLMIVHFVGEENSPFYKSEAFMTLLQRVTQGPTDLCSNSTIIGWR